MTNKIATIPDRITSQLFTYLPIATLGRCSEACSLFNKIINTETFWKQICHSNFPDSVHLAGEKNYLALAKKQHREEQNRNPYHCSYIPNEGFPYALLPGPQPSLVTLHRDSLYIANILMDGTYDTTIHANMLSCAPATPAKSALDFFLVREANGSYDIFRMSSNGRRDFQGKTIKSVEVPFRCWSTLPDALVLGQEDGTLSLIDTNDLTTRYFLRKGAPITALNAKHKKIAAGDEQGRVHVFHVASQEEILNVHCKAPISCVRIVRDRVFIARNSDEETIQAYEFSSGNRCLSISRGSGGWINSLAVHNHLLWTGGMNGTILRRDLRTDQEVQIDSSEGGVSQLLYQGNTLFFSQAGRLQFMNYTMEDPEPISPTLHQQRMDVRNIDGMVFTLSHILSTYQNFEYQITPVNTPWLLKIWHSLGAPTLFKDMFKWLHLSQAEHVQLYFLTWKLKRNLNRGNTPNFGELSFNNSSSIPLQCHCSPREKLDLIKKLLAWKVSQRARPPFLSLDCMDMIYRHAWIKKGRPIGIHDHFGRLAFLQDEELPEQHHCSFEEQIDVLNSVSLKLHQQLSTLSQAIGTLPPPEPSES